MKMPEEDALLLAADWCDGYEAEDESEDNKTKLTQVANWLREKSQEAMLKNAAKEGGVSVSALKKALANRSRAGQ